MGVLTGFRRPKLISYIAPKSLLSRDLFTHSSRFNKLWLAEQDLFLHLVGALFSNFQTLGFIDLRLGFS